MFSRVISAAVYGIDAYIVNVETDVGFGLPTFDMSGALGSKVREAKDRVRVAIKNSGIELTPQKIVINISPANIRKEGTIYDLPIAIGILTEALIRLKECFLWYVRLKRQELTTA